MKWDKEMPETEIQIKKIKLQKNLNIHTLEWPLKLQKWWMATKEMKRKHCNNCSIENVINIFAKAVPKRST